MLILHLVDELGGLEDSRAVPLGGKTGRDLILLRNHVLDLRHETVVLVMEDVVDGGEHHVFVGTRIAGDVVRVEELVVVKAGRGRTRIDHVVQIWLENWVGRIRVRVERAGVRIEVRYELLAGAGTGVETAGSAVQGGVPERGIRYTGNVGVL